MAVLMSLGGNSAGDGFLVAPLGSNYDAEIALWTDMGTATVTLQASPNPANLVFSTVGPIGLSMIPTIVTVHAQKQSGSRGDTTIQVLDGITPVVNFKVTCINHIVVNFNGRFETRFSTDPDRPYFNPIYLPPPNPDTIDTTGRTFGLEGEPDFVPGSTRAAPIVPTNLDLTGMGRNVRLNKPVALRSPAAPVVSKVVSISGDTATTGETFLAGDPLIGQPVNFGPDTYMASNSDDSGLPPGVPTPEESWDGGSEPLALFEIQIGTAPFTPPAIYFLGASNVGPFTGITAVNKSTRTPDSRPYAVFISLTAAAFAAAAQSAGVSGLSYDFQTFVDDRINALLADYAALPAGPSLQRRNLVRRIGHLLGCLAASYPLDPLLMSVPGLAMGTDVFTQRQGSDPGDWQSMETYTGKVDKALHAWPGGSPGASSVVAYLTQFFSFGVQWNAFAFNTDENCAYHSGWLSGDLTMTGNHIGDPHVHTVDGTAYDFQSVGEFTLLLDGNRLEIQVRQTPVPTANPATDPHSGLTECVSINTAVAVRMGAHRIAFQPGRDRQQLEFYLDGKPANMPADGIDLGGSRVTAFAASGETGIRVDFEDGTVVLITPTPWFANIWYLNVSVSNTSADEGVMGFIPKGSWLPRLRNGTDVGPMPASLHDRYVTLYKTFADSWRITDKTSLFVYAPGTSTSTFTDPDWPAEKLPCRLKPEFQIPGFQVLQGMPVARAEVICRLVTDKDLHQNCVFDVATTGDENFAKGYVFAQEVRQSGTSVKIVCHQAPSGQPYLPADVAADVPAQSGVHSVVVNATVAPLTPGRPIPTGSVTFFIDGVPMNRPVQLDDRGRARVKTRMKPGEHKIRATYSGGGKFDYHSSSSSTLVCSLGQIPPAPAGSVPGAVDHDRHDKD